MRGHVSTWWAPVAALALLVALAPASLVAQQGEYDPEDYELEADYDEDNYAFGIGAGIIEPDDGDGEIYFGANFRIRFGRRGVGDEDSDYDSDLTDEERYNDRYNNRHFRGSYGADTGGIKGYLEPEIGYWERSEQGDDFEDLLLGLNLVGVVPTRNADFFFGVGFGLHFTDGRRIITTNNVTAVVENDQEQLGGNVHVGVEIHVSESVGLWGAGRLDILEDEPSDRQTKIWGGIRFNW